MGIAYRIDKKKGIIFILWDGVITADTFLAQVQRLSSDPDWPPANGLHLCDLRATSVDASIDEVILKEAADIYGERLMGIPGIKVAIVANEEFMKAVVFEHFMAQYQPVVIVFNELDIACTWLGVGKDEAERAFQQLREGK